MIDSPARNIIQIGRDKWIFNLASLVQCHNAALKMGASQVRVVAQAKFCRCNLHSNEEDCRLIAMNYLLLALMTALKAKASKRDGLGGC